MDNVTRKVERGCDPGTAFQRSKVYELLSHAFGEPSEEFLAFVKEGEFLKHIADCLSAHPRRAEVDIRLVETAAAEAGGMEIERFSSEYERLTSPERNFLCECRYHQPFSSMEEMADIAGFYRAFGVCGEGERVDHLSMELEFMRLLTLKEAKTLIDKDMSKNEICIAAEKKFLEAHPGRWTSELSAITEGTGFFGPLSRFLDEWLVAECGFLSVRPQALFYSFREDTGGDRHSGICAKEEI